MVRGGEERGPRWNTGQRGEPEIAEPFFGFGCQPSHDLGHSQTRRGRRCLLGRGELNGGTQGIGADQQVRDRLHARQWEPRTRRRRGPKRAEPQPGGVEDLLQAVGVLDEFPKWSVCQIVEHRTGRQPHRLHLVAGVLVGRCGAVQQRLRAFDDPGRQRMRLGDAQGNGTYRRPEHAQHPVPQVHPDHSITRRRARPHQHAGLQASAAQAPGEPGG
jgi:hypothetical protein